MPPRLPKAAAAILSRIAIENEQRIVMRRTNAALIRKLKQQRVEAATRVANYEGDGRIYRPVIGDDGSESTVPDDTLLVEERESIADIDTQLKKLGADDKTPRMTAERLRRELDSNCRYVTCAVDVSLSKGETLKKALSRTRNTIDVKRAERKAIASASRTLEEVRESAMASIRTLAARGAPKVLPAFRGREIEWPMVQVMNSAPSYSFVPDGIALLAFLFQSQLERKVEALLEFNSDDSALSAVDQTARLQEIDDDLMSAYRQEAAIVEAIIADGGDAFHLADRPTIAVLGIRPA